MCKEESPAQATVNHSALQHLERFESLVLLVQLQHSSPHWALAALAPASSGQIADGPEPSLLQILRG